MPVGHRPRKVKNKPNPGGLFTERRPLPGCEGGGGKKNVTGTGYGNDRKVLAYRAER